MGHASILYVIRVMEYNTRSTPSVHLPRSRYSSRVHRSRKNRIAIDLVAEEGSFHLELSGVVVLGSDTILRTKYSYRYRKNKCNEKH
jgi:hypothetical protein